VLEVGLHHNERVSACKCDNPSESWWTIVVSVQSSFVSQVFRNCGVILHDLVVHCIAMSRRSDCLMLGHALAAFRMSSRVDQIYNAAEQEAGQAASALFPGLCCFR
jgi:hypothetical protein